MYTTKIPSGIDNLLHVLDHISHLYGLIVIDNTSVTVRVAQIWCIFFYFTSYGEYELAQELLLELQIVLLHFLIAPTMDSKSIEAD